MLINSVRIYPFSNNESALKATASVIVDGSLLLQSIRLIERPNGTIQVVYPSRKTPDNRYLSIFYPFGTEGHEILDNTILNAYQEYVADNTKTSFEFEPISDEQTFKSIEAFVHVFRRDEPDQAAHPMRARIGLRIDGILQLWGILLVTRQDGSLTLRMPYREVSDKNRFELFHPLKQSARDAMTSAALAAYDEAVLKPDNRNKLS